MITNKPETKKILALAMVFTLLAGAFHLSAETYSSSNFSVLEPVISSGSLSNASTNFGLGQTISPLAPGISTSSNFQLRSGFQYFYSTDANTLTAAAGNAQVALSWNAPMTYGEISVSSYEVGIGTISGSYTYTDVGNITSYTYAGLTNGTTYYFKIKSKASGGAILTFSNEASATPGGASTPPPAGGGGGGGGGGNFNSLPTPGGTSSVTVQGLAYPGTNVTLLKDGAVAAVTQSDPGASFNIQLNNLSAGTYAFSVYAIDSGGKQSVPYGFSQTLTAGVAATVSNVFLAPTISISNSEIKKGDTLNIFGYSVPQAQVNIFVHSDQEFVEKIQADSSGAWFKAFDTSFLEYGDHTTQSKALKNELISTMSEAVAFKVGTTNVKSTGSDKSLRADINKDGKVNITDFSILLYYWNYSVSSSAVAEKADINQDGIVNLTDLSILLYYWTG